MEVGKLAKKKKKIGKKLATINLANKKNWQNEKKKKNWLKNWLQKKKPKKKNWLKKKKIGKKLARSGIFKKMKIFGKNPDIC